MSTSSGLPSSNGEACRVVYNWQVGICEGKGSAGVVLALLCAFHDSKWSTIAKQGRVPTEVDLIQRWSLNYIREKTAGIFGEEAIRKALVRLQELGFIRQVSNPNPQTVQDNTRHYLVCAGNVMEAFEGFKEREKEDQICIQTREEGVVRNHTTSPQSQPPILRKVKKEEEETGRVQSRTRPGEIFLKNQHDSRLYADSRFPHASQVPVHKTDRGYDWVKILEATDPVFSERFESIFLPLTWSTDPDAARQYYVRRQSGQLSDAMVEIIVRGFDSAVFEDAKDNEGSPIRMCSRPISMKQLTFKSVLSDTAAVCAQACLRQLSTIKTSLELCQGESWSVLPRLRMQTHNRAIRPPSAEDILTTARLGGIENITCINALYQQWASKTITPEYTNLLKVLVEKEARVFSNLCDALKVEGFDLQQCEAVFGFTEEHIRQLGQDNLQRLTKEYDELKELLCAEN